MVTTIGILASNLFSTEPLNRVPDEPMVTEAPLDPTCRRSIGTTSGGGRVTILLGATHSFPGRQPLNLQTRLGPAVDGKTRVEVNKTRVSTTARVPDANPVGVARAAGAVGAAEGGVGAGGGGGGGVDVAVAGAGGGAVEGGLEERGGAVEVDDGVGAGDVEGEGVVELDPLVGFVGGDAGVGEEGCGLDDEALGFGVDGEDGVGVVQRVQEEAVAAAAAPYFVGGVAAPWAGAQGERHPRVAAGWAWAP